MPKKQQPKSTPARPKKDSKGRIIKSVTALARRIEGSTVAALLRGERGAGKTQFYLKILRMIVEIAYLRLYGRKLKWKGKGKATTEDIQEAAKRCLMCIVDMDLEGQEKLFERESILPGIILDRIEKWPVTGSSKDAEPEDYEDRFSEAIRARDYYLHLLRDHKQEYPIFDACRVLILEDCGELSDANFDHFFFMATRGKTRDFLTHYESITADRVFQGKPDKKKGERGISLFELGQRDTFGPVNLAYQEFFRECIKFKRVIGYHFYCTSRIGHKKLRDGAGKETGEIEKFTLGKTYLIEGYLDLILTFIKREKEIPITEGDAKGQTYKKSIYTIDTREGAKNRMSPEFWMYNDPDEGASKFFDRLREEQEKQLANSK